MWHYCAADEGDQSATALLEEIYAVPSDGEEEGMAPTEPCSQEPTFSGILRSNGLTSAEKHPAPATRPTLQGMTFSNHAVESHIAQIDPKLSRDTS